MKSLIAILLLCGMSSLFAATDSKTPSTTEKTSTTVSETDEILHCPEDYDKIFMSFSVSNSKSLGFSTVYYCVIKGVINTESGIKSIIKTIKTENKINGDVTPIYFQVLKD